MTTSAVQTNSRLGYKAGQSERCAERLIVAGLPLWRDLGSRSSANLGPDCPGSGFQGNGPVLAARQAIAEPLHQSLASCGVETHAVAGCRPSPQGEGVPVAPPCGGDAKCWQRGQGRGGRCPTILAGFCSPSSPEPNQRHTADSPTEKSCQVSGVPGNSISQCSSNVRPEPAVRSRTVRDTMISPGPA